MMMDLSRRSCWAVCWTAWAAPSTVWATFTRGPPRCQRRAINPVTRVYPRNYIHTGISSIDCLATLIRGQKLPIFSGSGMKHNELAAQIVRQASVADGRTSPSSLPPWASRTTWPTYFRESFESCGAMERVVMFLNLANDPIIERILTPRCALTAAEYLAFDLQARAGHLDRYDLLLRGPARVLLLQGRDPRPQGLPRLPVLRPGLPVRARRHDQGQHRFGDPDPDPHHAQRRHHPPHPRPDRLHHRGADRAGPGSWTATACIRRSPCCPPCPV